jgi:hypothetical protein
LLADQFLQDAERGVGLLEADEDGERGAEQEPRGYQQVGSEVPAPGAAPPQAAYA